MDVKQPRRLNGDNPLSQPLRAVQEEIAPTVAPKPKKQTTTTAKREQHSVSLLPELWRRLQLNAMTKGETASGIIEQLIITHTDNVGITRRKVG
jgi:hypothetical protein